jgi:hypothetical protein
MRCDMARIYSLRTLIPGRLMLRVGSLRYCVSYGHGDQPVSALRMHFTRPSPGAALPSGSGGRLPKQASWA